jgi:hypothetical protein
MRSIHRWGHIAPAAGLLSLSLVLGGCGDSSSGGAAATAASASSGNAGTITGTITRSGTASTTVGYVPGTSATPGPTVAQKFGHATLSWLAPSTNTDGSALTNLAGFIIRYGTQPANLNRLITIAGVGISGYVIESLSSGMWYFTVSTYTTAGVESPPSVIVSQSI